MQPTRRHTRSQPLSPGGFLSLETVTPSRRKRATRNASQTTSETPTHLETHKEPTSSTHPVTRSRLNTQPATNDESEPTTQSKKTTRNAKGKTGTRRSTRKTKAKATEAETIDTAESANSETPELSSFDSNVDETDHRVESNADREIGTKATREQAKLPESAEVKDVGTSTSQSSKSELNHPPVQPKEPQEPQDNGYIFPSPPPLDDFTAGEENIAPDYYTRLGDFDGIDDHEDSYITEGCPWSDSEVRDFLSRPLPSYLDVSLDLDDDTLAQISAALDAHERAIACHKESSASHVSPSPKASQVTPSTAPTPQSSHHEPQASPGAPTEHTEEATVATTGEPPIPADAMAVNPSQDPDVVDLVVRLSNLTLGASAPGTAPPCLSPPLLNMGEPVHAPQRSIFDAEFESPSMPYIAACLRGPDLTPTWVPAPVLEIPFPLPRPSIYSDVPLIPLTINGVHIRHRYVDEPSPVAGHEAADAQAEDRTPLSPPADESESILCADPQLAFAASALATPQGAAEEGDTRIEGTHEKNSGKEAWDSQLYVPEGTREGDSGKENRESQPCVLEALQPWEKDVLRSGVPKENKTKERKKLTTKLETRTRKKGSKKRSHCETSDDEQTKTKTNPNKRRNLGAARGASHTGISPASRRILNNPVPYSERLRRRTVESRQGRIRRTIFRLPQVVAQAEADRLTSPTEESEGSSRTEMPSTASQDVSDEKEHAIESAPQSTSHPQTAEALQTPSKRWSIRGLIGSVPRSFARILPGWGAGDHSPKEPETPRPSSERITRTTLPDVPSISEGKVRQPLFSTQQPITTEEKQDDTPRDLSYSLFPPPIDRSRFLGTTSDAPKSSAPMDEQSTANTSVSNKRRASGPNPAVVEESDSTEDLSQRKTETPRIKKRKRSPTPEIIPNPPGVSYGMDMRYFTYSSSESEDESEEISPPAKRTRGNDTAVMHNMRSAIRSETGPSKKVRFDASPENTPSKTRAKARATDPYRGRQFVGMGGDSNVSTPPRIPATYGDFPRRPGFVFNTEGTYGFDYSDDSESDEETTSYSVAAPSDAPTVNVESESQDHEPKELPPPAPTPRHASLPPSTPSKVDEEALAKARSQAEKYKPKTPSGLRMSSRYSSPLTASPLAASPMTISPAANPPATTSAMTAASPVTTSSMTAPTTTSSAIASAITVPASTTSVTTSPAITSLMAASPLTASVTASTNVSLSPLDDAFGTDRFARDAKWLYDLCPSGNLQEFQWPEKKNVQESLDLDVSTDILTHVFDHSEVDHTYNFFKSAFEEFTASLA